MWMSIKPSNPKPYAGRSSRPKSITNKHFANLRIVKVIECETVTSDYVKCYNLSIIMQCSFKLSLLVGIRFEEE